MKKNRHLRLLQVFVLLILVLGLSFVSSNASEFSLYDRAMADMQQHMKEDPSVVLSEVFYKANKDKDPSAFLSLEEIKASDSSTGESTEGNYTFEKLMTYREFFDLGLDSGLSFDIDADRMVWVLTFEHTGLFEFNGVMLRNVVTTTVWDAETGTALSFGLHTTDPKFHTAGSAAPLDAKN